MFDTIPIDVLFLIFSYLPSVRSFLSVNCSLHSKTTRYLPEVIRERCIRRQWKYCCRSICESGYLELLENAIVNYTDLRYLGEFASVEVVNLLICRNTTIDVSALLNMLIMHKNILAVRYCVMTRKYDRRLADFAVYYGDIDTIDYMISKGIRIAKYLIKGAIHNIETYNHLLSLPPTAFNDYREPWAGDDEP
jgi:hypothetical protein